MKLYRVFLMPDSLSPDAHSTSHTTQSGGVTIGSAANDVNVGGDVVGRDKIVNATGDVVTGDVI